MIPATKDYVELKEWYVGGELILREMNGIEVYANKEVEIKINHRFIRQEEAIPLLKESMELSQK